MEKRKKIFIGFLFIALICCMMFASSRNLYIFKKSGSEKQYAELNYHNDTTPLIINIPFPNIYYNVTGLDLGISNLITQQNDNLIIYEDGVYTLSLSVSFGGGATREYEFAVFVNDIEIENCEFHRVMGTGGDIGSGSTECLLNLNAGDVINIRAEDENNPSQNVEIYAFNFNIVKIEGVNSESITNKTINPNKVCFDTDVCIQEGTDSWIWLRDKADTVNRNLRVYNFLATNVIELSPNAKLIFGYPDIDKYMVYDSANDEVDIRTDNITLSLEDTILEENAYANTVEFGRQKNFAGYIIRSKKTTASGHMYYEDKYGGPGGAIVNRWRTDGGEQFISNNGAVTTFGGEVQVNDLNTGINEGTPLCSDANSQLCICGSCA